MYLPLLISYLLVVAFVITFGVLLIFRNRKNHQLSSYIAELENKKKIISALWNIEHIILETLDYQEVIQRVANAVLLELGKYGFVIIVLSLIDKEKNVLKRISISQTEEAREALKFAPIPFSEITIPLSAKENTCVKAIDSVAVQTTHQLSDLLAPVIDKKLSDKAQKAAQIKASIVSPIVLRGEVLGVLIFSLKKSESEISSYEKEIMNGFASAVGIAVQNSTLYRDLDKTSKELQAANEKLKELDKLKDEFVSIASHELRTPMTAIKSYLWMALAGKAGELNEKMQKYLERSYISVDRLINLVNGMLNVSRIESGRIELNKQAMSIYNLANDVMEEVRPKATEKELNLSVQLVKDLPMVFADWNKIREVLTNLVGNSLKFTPGGGKISINFKVKDSFVDTSVTDTGVGISDMDKAKLFQKFGLGQHSYTTAHTGGGSGLGLYISKSLVELHGGTMWFESTEGKGSTFTFSLTIVTDEELIKFGKFDTNHVVKEEIDPGGAGIIPTQHF